MWINNKMHISNAKSHRKSQPLLSPKMLTLCLIFGLLIIIIYFNISYLSSYEDRKKESVSEKIFLRQDDHEVPPLSGNYPGELNAADFETMDGCDFSGIVKSFKPENLDLNCKNIGQLVTGEKLGSGFWRKVYAADWKGRKVAVKLVRSNLLSRNDIVKRHVKEAAGLYLLRDSPNIVKLIGWCNSTVVVEYVEGKLEDLVFDPSVPISVERALELALDAAKGVEQLHAVQGGPIAHTDIQTRQFLFDDSGKLLLNDFNRMKYTGTCNLPGKSNQKCLYRTPTAKGKWRSPEEYNNHDLDEKVDIYSLSLVLWTLRSRTPPFEDLSRSDVYSGVSEKRTRPPVKLMKDYPKEMQELIQQAWHHDPTRRPSASKLVQEIDRILRNYKASL